ncbi:hypothetical protein [Microbispora bryophytorum]|uniref:hypothetical protein n=1 Tax=Microbispora bryophytorum TaxID=1460882 RepID=UPI00371B5DE5
MRRTPSPPERRPTIRGNVLNGDDARLRGGLQFIADKNLPSLVALGSVLNGKSAEGYPGHWYDRGGEIADRAEQIAVERPSGCSGQMSHCAALPRHHGHPGGVRGPSTAGGHRRSRRSAAATSPAGPRSTFPAGGCTSSPTTVTSGSRTGTLCATTQDTGAAEMREIASLVVRAIRQPGAITSILERVKGLTATHLAYPRQG